jgi:hypothetical protein
MSQFAHTLNLRVNYCSYMYCLYILEVFCVRSRDISREILFRIATQGTGIPSYPFLTLLNHGLLSHVKWLSVCRLQWTDHLSGCSTNGLSYRSAFDGKWLALKRKGQKMWMGRVVRKHMNGKEETLKIRRIQRRTFMKFEVFTKIKTHITVSRIHTQRILVSYYL